MEQILITLQSKVDKWLGIEPIIRDVHVVSSWLLANKWHLYIGNLDEVALAQLVTPPCHNNDLYLLSHAVKEYFAHCTSFLLNTEVLVVQYLNSLNLSETWAFFFFIQQNCASSYILLLYNQYSTAHTSVLNDQHWLCITYLFCPPSTPCNLAPTHHQCLCIICTLSVHYWCWMLTLNPSIPTLPVPMHHFCIKPTLLVLMHQSLCITTTLSLYYQHLNINPYAMLLVPMIQFTCYWHL